MAVEGRARRAGDGPGLDPQAEQLKNPCEQESGDDDEGNPKEGIEFSGGQVSEKNSAATFVGIASSGSREMEEKCEEGV